MSGIAAVALGNDDLSQATRLGTLRKYLVQIAIVCVAYVVAGKLGQATTNIRSSNLGPVWPAYGIALAAILKYRYRVWPGMHVNRIGPDEVLCRTRVMRLGYRQIIAHALV